jgi:ribose/xylose/arabinose/galactoside ABC-type transport system permease subunit
MEIVVTLVLFYLAVGAALFAHSSWPLVPNDFDWRTQSTVFRATFVEVLAWPLALFRLCADRD